MLDLRDSWQKIWNQIKLSIKRIISKFPPFYFKEYIRESFIVSLFAVSLPLTNYTNQDITVSEPQEVIFLLFFFAIMASLLLLTYWLWLRKAGERIIATILATIFLAAYYSQVLDHFSGIREKIGSVFSAVLIQLVVYLVCGGLAFTAGQIEKVLERRKIVTNPIRTIVLIMAITTILFNSYTFVDYLVSHHKATAFKPDYSLLNNMKITSGDKRDIYYFVFDRYANNESLIDYFNYDNSAFLNSLKDQGFYIRDQAYANYQFTAPSVASTVRMDYHNDMSEALFADEPINYLPYKTILERSPTATLLKRSGYEVYNLGNWWNPTRTQAQATNVLPQFEMTLFNKSTILSELQSDVVSHTFLGGYLKRGFELFGFTFLRINYADAKQLYEQQIQELTALAEEKHDAPRFVMAHLLNPHPPYLFAADGSIPPYSSGEDNQGAPREIKYSQQLEYVNKTLSSVIDTIIKHSKTEPIIIIQSDEGPYPLTPVEDWLKTSPDTLKLKFGVLGAYYFPDTTEEQRANLTSSVNAFRFVFNQYFDAQMKYLPNCSFVFNNGNAFTFHEITSQIQKADDGCNKIHPVK